MTKAKKYIKEEKVVFFSIMFFLLGIVFTAFIMAFIGPPKTYYQEICCQDEIIQTENCPDYRLNITNGFAFCLEMGYDTYSSYNEYSSEGKCGYLNNDAKIENLKEKLR